LIGNYDGLRLDEICQLHLEDIRQERATWVFDINEKPDRNGKKNKKLKNASAERVIPIHPKLIQLGLLEWVEKLRNKDEIRLFPELKKNRDGYSHIASKWFSRYRKRCGITGHGKVFHSFRHTVANWLADADVPDERIADILGHTNGTETGGPYRKAFKPGLLLDSLQRLDYGLQHPPCPFI